MRVLNINSNKDVSLIDKLIKQGCNVFILVYMEGCGPCNATRPEWSKLETALKDQYKKNDNLVIVDINKDYVSGVKHIGSIDGFPTMKYIGKNGKKVESYEDSSIKNKNRSVDSFIEWIESNINSVKTTNPTSSSHNVYKRLSTTNKKKSKTKTKSSTKKMHGGKWTRKYKKSINCRRPKGFSQRQYCKYGRKH